MFGGKLQLGVQSVKVRVRKAEGRHERRCRVVLAHEFTVDIARELGPEALDLLEALKHKAVEKAVLPIGALVAIGTFKPAKSKGKPVKIGRMIGVRATVLAAKLDEEQGPTVQLEFEFEWQKDAWGFLGEHCAIVVETELVKRQLTLALGDDKKLVSKDGGKTAKVIKVVKPIAKPN